MKVEYIQHYGTDLTVVNAARVSFDKQSEWEYYDEDGRGPCDSPSHCGEYFNIAKLKPADEKLIHYLAKHKHTSCFEHMGATLKLKVPIFIARQIQRHRTFSYNEISRRYVDSEPEFYWPDKWRKRADNVKQGSSDEEVVELLPVKCFDDPAGLRPWPMQVVEHVVYNDSMQMYQRMLDSGVAPEQARMILPQNLYTEFYMSGSLRNFSHFLKLRLHEHAQVEAQQVAQMILEILKPLFPVSMEALMKYD